MRDDLTAGDLGLAYQVSRILAIGVSASAVLRTAEVHTNALLIGTASYACGPGAAASCHNFIFGVQDEDTLAIGGRGKLGVRLTPSDAWSFGLAVTSPTFHIYGYDKLDTAERRRSRFPTRPGTRARSTARRPRGSTPRARWACPCGSRSAVRS